MKTGFQRKQTQNKPNPPRARAALMPGLYWTYVHVILQTTMKLINVSWSQSELTVYIGNHGYPVAHGDTCKAQKRVNGDACVASIVLIFQHVNIDKDLHSTRIRPLSTKNKSDDRLDEELAKWMIEQMTLMGWSINDSDSFERSLSKSNKTKHVVPPLIKIYKN